MVPKGKPGYEDSGFLDALKDLISDNNPIVVANVIAALTEIQESSSRPIFQITSHTLSKFLTALNECTEWGQVFVLDALSKYKAVDAHKAENIVEYMNKLLLGVKLTCKINTGPLEIFITRVKTTLKIEDEEYVDAGEQGYSDSPGLVAESGTSPPASTTNAQHPTTRQPAAPTALALPDLLDLGMDNNNSTIVSADQHTTPVDPPLPIVLPASSGQGLQINAQLVGRDG
ncbi:hypothetical protein BC332_15382 [Capsicum chinense]|nr:hypothetical protein BC332_15382 [Capsicum chinense]